MKEMVKMKIARLVYILVVLMERVGIILFTFDKYIEHRLGNPVLANTHGFDLVLYLVPVLIIAVMSYVMFWKRSILISWILLLKKDIDSKGYYQRITDEIEERA